MPKNFPIRLFNFKNLPPTVGLMAAWNLGDLVDASGNGNLLTNNNGVIFSAGKLGLSATFNGVNQSLSIADNAFLSGGGEVPTPVAGLGAVGVTFGICGWFKLTALPTAGNTMGIVSKWTTGTQQEYVVEVNEFGALIFRVSADGGSVHGFDIPVKTPDNNIFINTWVFFCAWYDGFQINLELNNNGVIYINQLTVTTTPQGIFDGTSNFRIGAFDTPAGSFFNGQIDAIRIYKHTDKIFNNDERAALFNNGIGRQFVINTTISSDEVNRELNQIINIINGINKDVTPVISPSNLINEAALTINQNGLGPIARVSNNTPTVVVEIKNNGQYKSYTVNPTPPFISLSGGGFSNALVTNLNVDLLNGVHADAILQTTSLLPICNSVGFINASVSLLDSILLVVSGNQLLTLFVQQDGIASLDASTTIRFEYFRATRGLLGDIIINGNNNSVVSADIVDIDLTTVLDNSVGASNAFGLYRLIATVIAQSGSVPHTKVTVGATSRQLPI